MIWTVVATVRRSKAIGRCYPVCFEVEVALDQNVKDQWFFQHGDDWELFHFDRIALFQLSSSQKVHEENQAQIRNDP